MKSTRLPLLVLSSLIISSCQLAEQWQEARKLDEEYAQYIERCEKENESLVKLKKAAAEAAGAQIRIMHAFAGKSDIIIPLSDDELSTVREIIPHLQDMPALCREAWDCQQEAFRNMTHANYFRFIDLEFLNEKGEKTDELLLTAGFGTSEHAEDCKREFYVGSPLSICYPPTISDDSRLSPPSSNRNIRDSQLIDFPTSDFAVADCRPFHAH